MENRQLTDHEFCEKVRRVHQGNRTLNHIEDNRPIWDIMKAGLQKMRPLNLRKIVQTRK